MSDLHIFVRELWSQNPDVIGIEKDDEKRVVIYMKTVDYNLLRNLQLEHGDLVRMEEVG